MSLMQSAHRSVMKCSHFHFTYEEKRDIASYSQKTLEHLIPLEISCRGALKCLQKNTHAWEISSGLPSIQHLAESPKMWQMHVSVSRGTAVTPGTAAPRDLSLLLWYPGAQLALPGDLQAHPAGGKLHLLHQLSSSELWRRLTWLSITADLS